MPRSNSGCVRSAWVAASALGCRLPPKNPIAKRAFGPGLNDFLAGAVRRLGRTHRHRFLDPAPELLQFGAQLCTRVDGLRNRNRTHHDFLGAVRSLSASTTNAHGQHN